MTSKTILHFPKAEKTILTADRGLTKRQLQSAANYVQETFAQGSPQSQTFLYEVIIAAQTVSPRKISASRSNRRMFELMLMRKCMERLVTDIHALAVSFVAFLIVG